MVDKGNKINYGSAKEIELLIIYIFGLSAENVLSQGKLTS